MTTTLGLDLGPNSIGWAMVDEKAQRLVDLGVRIFPEGVDNFNQFSGPKKEQPRNKARRNARMMRRQILRRSRRKQQLRQALIEKGLFPEDAKEQRQLLEKDPYALRAQALDEKLTLHEIGRVILQLNQRRGFRSNRKSEQKQKDTSDMLKEMAELDKTIEASGTRTLGEYLLKEKNGPERQGKKEFPQIRNKHIQRRWLMDEFEKIWQAQSKYYPQLLTDQLAYGTLGRLKDIHNPIAKYDPRREGKDDLQSFGLFGLIFFHRTLKPIPKEVVGLCELEPKQRRCARADRHAQRFRLLQEVNNLRLIDQTGQERGLNEQERALVLDKLSSTKEATFDQIRGWMGKLPNSPAPEQIKFNLEQGKRKKLQGMVTDAMLANKNIIGKSWWDFPQDMKDTIVRVLVNNLDDEQTRPKLLESGLTQEQAEAALSIDFTNGPTKGYVNFSLCAIDKLMPFLEKGMRLMGNDENDSAIHAAGYLRQDQLKQRLFDKLPNPQHEYDAPIGDIPNPVVRRALVELRTVVNAIIREYGRPDNIHIELAREVRQSHKQRQDYTKRIRENEAQRDEAKKILDDSSQSYGAGGSNILKVRLWKQQGEQCPYCGHSISQAQLLNDGQVDVDHILPYSRSLDDSQMNKVVCHRHCNHDKGNKTPYEWLANSEPQRYEQVKQYAYSMVKKGQLPYRKYQRFVQKELELDNFINAQLNATAYISKMAVQYLKCLFSYDEQKSGVVLGLKGQLTAELRRQWGLNNLLRDDDLNIKTRDDHRHHAVDAVVVAMTNRPRLNKLSGIRKAGGVLNTGQSLPEPWDHFRDEVDRKIKMLNGGFDESGQQRGISHRVQRKVKGALHKETNYGAIYDRFKQRISNQYVVRKPLMNLSPSEIDNIRDEGIKKIVQKHLQEAGIETGRGKKKDNAKWTEALSNVVMASGVPIKKVRILVTDNAIQPIRQDQAEKNENPDLVAWVSPGATHHLCIFEFMKNGKKKRDAVFVTQLEATNRLKRQGQELAKRMEQWEKQSLNKEQIKTLKAKAMHDIAEEHPLIQRDVSKLTGDDKKKIPASADFVMSLAQGELVLADWKGEQKILKFKTAASTQGQLYFGEHTDSRKSTEYRKYVTYAQGLIDKDVRKITIDPLGRVRWAND